MKRRPIQSHKDLETYQIAFEAAMEIFKITKEFPIEERYSLSDQIRRSSRSVCANLAEAWRKRRYERAFLSKLSDSEAEAAETQTWLEFVQACNYADAKTVESLSAKYDRVLGKLVTMINNPSPWLLPQGRNK